MTRKKEYSRTSIIRIMETRLSSPDMKINESETKLKDASLRQSEINGIPFNGYGACGHETPTGLWLKQKKNLKKFQFEIDIISRKTSRPQIIRYDYVVKGGTLFSEITTS